MRIVRPIQDPATAAAVQDSLCRRDTRFGLLWRIGVHSGLRISDLLKLRPKDFKGRKLTVREQKSSKRKVIVFDKLFVNDIRQYAKKRQLRPGDFLFYRNRLHADVPMSRQWARAVIASEARKLNVDEIGAHSMRKIYACEIYRRTGSLEAVQKALNHSKAETTLIYLKDVLSSSGDV